MPPGWGAMSRSLFMTAPMPWGHPGEKIRPLKSWKKRLWHILVVPGINAPTKEIYQEFDKERALNFKAGTRLAALASQRSPLGARLSAKPREAEGSRGKPRADPGVCSDIKAMLFNRLEEAAFRRYPQVREVKEILLKEAGLENALMSGSGSAVFGLVDSRKEGLRIAKGFSRFKDWKIFVVKN